MCQFKAKDSEIKPYPLCVKDIAKDFTVDKMKRTGLGDMYIIFPLIIILPTPVIL